MHLLELTKIVDDTFQRTIKFNSNGSVGHNLDRDVFRVIAIAVAADILDRHTVTKKED
jgi:hypothetical protein